VESESLSKEVDHGYSLQDSTEWFTKKIKLMEMAKHQLELEKEGE
jgi:hypothetical protein